MHSLCWRYPVYCGSIVKTSSFLAKYQIFIYRTWLITLCASPRCHENNFQDHLNKPSRKELPYLLSSSMVSLHLSFSRPQIQCSAVVVVTNQPLFSTCSKLLNECEGRWSNARDANGDVVDIDVYRVWTWIILEGWYGLMRGIGDWDLLLFTHEFMINVNCFFLHSACSKTVDNSGLYWTVHPVCSATVFLIAVWMVQN